MRIPASGAPPLEMPSTDLPNGFKWQNNCAIHEFECQNKKLTLTIPIHNKQEAHKILSTYTKDKIDLIGKIGIAAGIGEESLKITFEANAHGDFNFTRHLKNGKSQVLNEQFFQSERQTISQAFVDPIQQNHALSKINTLKTLIASMQNIFTKHAFKGQNNSQNPIQNEKSEPDIEKQKQEMKVKRQKLNIAVTARLKKMLFTNLQIDIALKPDMDEFFERNLGKMDHAEFLERIFQDLKNKNNPANTNPMDEKQKDTFATFYHFIGGKKGK